MCGAKSPEVDSRPQAWNSTLKQNPKKRMERSRLQGRSKRKRKRKQKQGKTSLKDAMKRCAEEWREESLKRFGMVVCENCGREIRELSADNISHIVPRSIAPHLRTAQENMEVLCGASDYFGSLDISCHTLWENYKIEQFAKRSNEQREVREPASVGRLEKLRRGIVEP